MNEVANKGIAIVRTATGIGVDATRFPSSDVLNVEIEYLGKPLCEEAIPGGALWRDAYKGVDMLACGVRVKRGKELLAELEAPRDKGPRFSFMVRQGEQRHITEAYVSVPPALTITDERGDIWTLGFTQAPDDLAPAGEFAFNVLRNGVDLHEFASRIERRNGKVRVFTRRGWKIWNGSDLI